MNLRTNTELAVAIALAAVLSLVRIKLPHLLYGGSVSLHALPILAVAIRHARTKLLERQPEDNNTAFVTVEMATRFDMQQARMAAPS